MGSSRMLILARNQVGLEQAMQVHHYVSHLGVVHRFLRGTAPRLFG